jgi:hypothetical protein
VPRDVHDRRYQDHPYKRGIEKNCDGEPESHQLNGQHSGKARRPEYDEHDRGGLNPRHIGKLPRDFCYAGLIYSLPLITIAAATAFGWMLAYLRGAIVISDWITGLAGNDPHLIMLLLVLLFTIVGDFIEPVPTIIIFMPLVNSLTEAGSINPVHMGVVLIVTLAFGLITPPYGLVLLMASKFVGVPFSKALKAALPIYVVFLATIVFTIYVPSAILWLPKHVMPQSVGCFPNPSGSGYICPP